MSQNTRQEVICQMRRRYLRARHHRSQLVGELVERFDYHRKAALRALRPKPVLARTRWPGSEVRGGQRRIVGAAAERAIRREVDRQLKAIEAAWRRTGT